MTGSGRGLGRAVALRLAGDGARLLLVDIDPTTATDCANEVQCRRGTARVVTADVSDESSCWWVVDAAVEVCSGP